MIAVPPLLLLGSIARLPLPIFRVVPIPPFPRAITVFPFSRTLAMPSFSRAIALPLLRSTAMSPSMLRYRGIGLLHLFCGPGPSPLSFSLLFILPTSGSHPLFLLLPILRWLISAMVDTDRSSQNVRSAKIVNRKHGTPLVLIFQECKPFRFPRIFVPH